MERISEFDAILEGLQGSKFRRLQSTRKAATLMDAAPQNGRQIRPGGSAMRIRDESGQALVVVALVVPVVVGCIALAVDLGVLYHEKRNLQIAADAAALAGAQDYLYNSSASSATTDAKAASSANGFTDGSNGVVVTASVPPADGPNSGAAGYVEVVVSKPINTIFMSVLGYNKITVKARGVAGTPTIGDACIWALKSTGTGLDVQGGYDIEAPSCGVYVNSTSSNGVQVTGNGGIMNTAFVDAVGNSVPGHQTSPTPVTPNTAPRTNPFGGLTGPTPTNSGCATTDSTTTTLSGAITGPGAGAAVCYTKAVTIGNATLGAGVYMFENGVTIGVGDTVTINSGTIDIYGGTLNQKSNSLLNITAPTSGSYNGIAILQPATNTTNLQVQFGSNNETLDGYIYAPGAEVYLQDNGGGIVATGIVANIIYDKSSTIRVPSYDKKHPTTTPNRVITLTE